MGTVASDGGAPSILTVEWPGRPNLTLTSLDGSLGPNRDRTQGLGSDGVGESNDAIPVARVSLPWQGAGCRECSIFGGAGSTLKLRLQAWRKLLSIVIRSVTPIKLEHAERNVSTKNKLLVNMELYF